MIGLLCLFAGPFAVLVIYCIWLALAFLIFGLPLSYWQDKYFRTDKGMPIWKFAVGWGVYLGGMLFATYGPLVLSIYVMAKISGQIP